MSETAEVEFEGKVTTWQRTGDTRFLVCVQGHQTLGPLLQEAWVCREDGAVKWRRVPVHHVSPAEFMAAATD